MCAIYTSACVCVYNHRIQHRRWHFNVNAASPLLAVLCALVLQILPHVRLSFAENTGCECVFLRGMYTYINSDPQTLDQKHRLIRSIPQIKEKEYEQFTIRERVSYTRKRKKDTEQERMNPALFFQSLNRLLLTEDILAVSRCMCVCVVFMSCNHNDCYCYYIATVAKRHQPGFTCITAGWVMEKGAQRQKKQNIFSEGEVGEKNRRQKGRDEEQMEKDEKLQPKN